MRSCVYAVRLTIFYVLRVESSAWKSSAIKIISACVLLTKRGKTHRGGLLGHGSDCA